MEGIRRRWAFGKDVNGGIIGRYRNQDYQAFKVSTNPRAGGNVDLTLTGALGDGLTIRKAGDKKYEVFSTDYKFERISIKYGIEQFNLDSQQQEDLFDMLYYMAFENYLDNVWLV